MINNCSESIIHIGGQEFCDHQYPQSYNSYYPLPSDNSRVITVPNTKSYIGAMLDPTFREYPDAVISLFEDELEKLKDSGSDTKEYVKKLTRLKKKLDKLIIEWI